MPPRQIGIMDDAPGACDVPGMRRASAPDTAFMRQALALARKAIGETSPNPMVGALLVRNGKVIGRGWHHKAGQPHAEIEALRDCEAQGHSPRGATLYVTLEPCCTHGRTPPCTDAIQAAGIRTVVVAATDPNPRHAGHGFTVLKKAGIHVRTGVLSEEATTLNTAFNHWIVHRTPWITLKAAMSLDGKIADAYGESKWITSPDARTWAMRLRRAADAILVGVNTVIADDPSLTLRSRRSGRDVEQGRLRIVIDPRARTPLDARILKDAFAEKTRIVVSPTAPRARVKRLQAMVQVIEAPSVSVRGRKTLDLPWLMKHLGETGVTHILVEGGGETHAGFLASRLAHEVAFFYAPKVLGGHTARRAIGGEGAQNAAELLRLSDVRCQRIGPDLLYRARILPATNTP